MDTKNVHITYTSASARKPITQRLIQEYPSLGINILRAQVSPDSGWIEFQVTGNPVTIEEAVSWLKGQGVQVKILGE